MGGVVFILGLIAIIFALLLAIARSRLRFGYQTIYEWQRGLLYRQGRFSGELGPGAYWIHPFRTIVPVTTAEQLLLVPAQEVLSSDGFPVKLGAVVRYRIVNARIAQERHEGGPTEALRVVVQLALRGIAAPRPIDALLAARGDLDRELQSAVIPNAEGLGIEITQISLRDIILPAEVRRMLTEVERARREGLAALERARGEQAALRALSNAARMLKSNPELQNLRVLQALSATGGRSAPTLVLSGGNGLFVPLRPSEDGGKPADEPEQRVEP